MLLAITDKICDGEELSVGWCKIVAVWEIDSLSAVS